jgi:hypothetical protein
VDSQPTLLQDQPRAGSPDLDCDRIKKYSPPWASKGPTEDLKSTLFGIEQLRKEKRQRWKGVVARRARDAERRLAYSVAQPEKAGEVSDVVRMKMADGQEIQVSELGTRFSKAHE